MSSCIRWFPTFIVCIRHSTPRIDFWYSPTFHTLREILCDILRIMLFHYLCTPFYLGVDYMNIDDAHAIPRLFPCIFDTYNHLSHIHSCATPYIEGNSDSPFFLLLSYHYYI